MRGVRTHQRLKQSSKKMATSVAAVSWLITDVAMTMRGPIRCNDYIAAQTCAAVSTGAPVRYPSSNRLGVTMSAAGTNASRIAIAGGRHIEASGLVA